MCLRIPSACRLAGVGVVCSSAGGPTLRRARPSRAPLGRPVGLGSPSRLRSGALVLAAWELGSPSRLPSGALVSPSRLCSGALEAASVALPPVLEHPDVFYGAPRRCCAVRTCLSVGVELGIKRQTNRSFVEPHTPLTSRINGQVGRSLRMPSSDLCVYLVLGALSVPAGRTLFRLPRLVMPLFFAVGVG